jgi:HD-GYP domain-containing protein (c-di-GMP phosphodiesterase class II)
MTVTATRTAVPELERDLLAARERLRRTLAGREWTIRGTLAAAFAVSAVALALAGRTDRHPAWWAYPAAVAAYAAVSSIRIELGSTVALPTELVLVPMLFTLPPQFVPLLVAAAMLVAAIPDVWRRRMSPQRAIVWGSNAFFSIGPAAVFVAAGAPRPSLHGGALLALAVAAQFACDAVFTTVTERLAFGVALNQVAASLGWVFAIDGLVAPIAFGLTVANARQGGLILLGAPLLALFVVFASERRSRLDSFLDLSTAYRGTAMLLGTVVEADDEYTGDHSRQVLELVLAVSKRLGLPSHELRLAELSALLHDVGKIKIPNEIINKPGPLTREERAIVNTHTIEGERLLRPIGGLFAEVGTIVRACHERWDGGGYPDGLEGDRIPLVARIVAACDAFNAMTTDRPYRRALPHDQALAELVLCSGAQFDPEVVEALLFVVS